MNNLIEFVMKNNIYQDNFHLLELNKDLKFGCDENNY
jgi:hypothetical protein